MALKSNANSIIIDQLTERLCSLEQRTKADIIVICAPIRFGLDSVVRDALEAIPDKKRTIGVVLETGGGYIEVTQRIAQALRQHYRVVNFIIPNYAYSAGTVLAMSGDAILMDYFSVLGPIDPQLPQGDKMVPALGYLEQYDRLIEKSRNGTLTTAETAFLINRFDPAELYMYEQARELSISLLKEWLVKYKFKNWKTTQTRKLPVTKAMRVARAEEIAKALNKIAKWNSHGRGIPMAVLRKDLKLIIEDFGADADLNASIKDYHKLLQNYLATVQHDHVVHTRKDFLAMGRSS
jgi:membrane-bound ClpP family serine protease